MDDVQNLEQGLPNTNSSQIKQGRGKSNKNQQTRMLQYQYVKCQNLSRLGLIPRSGLALVILRLVLSDKEVMHRGTCFSRLWSRENVNV